MEQGQHMPIEEMELFQQFVAVADAVWDIVTGWAPLAADTVGKQLIRAADSVGANLVEGDGRHSHADALHFFVIARGSARETRYWIRRALVRKLLAQESGNDLLASLTSATRQLNSLIRYRRSQAGRPTVKESLASYTVASEDPFTAD